MQFQERGPDRFGVIRRGHEPGPGVPDQLGRRSVGRHGGKDRPADGDVLEDLPGEHPLATAACLRDQEKERLGVPLERQGLGARRVGQELEPIAESEAGSPLAVCVAEVAHEPRDDVEVGVVERLYERPRVAATEEAARVRDPEALRRVALQSGDVVEVGPVRDRGHGPLRVEGARLLGDGLGDARDRVRAGRHESCDPLVERRLRPRRRGVGSAVRVGHQRVPQVGHPADAGRASDRGGDQMRRAGRRRRHDHVDPVVSDESDADGDGGQRPRGVLVRDNKPTELQACLRDRALEPLRAGKYLGRLPAAHADVARAVHPRLGRQPEALVSMQPARVVGCEHVGLDPHRREVLRELQRSLDAASARGGEVEADEEGIHGGDRSWPSPVAEGGGRVRASSPRSR